MNQALRDILAASPEATDAEIVALAAADRRTVRPIPLPGSTGLRRMMSKAGLRSRLLRTLEAAAFAAVCQQAGQDATEAADGVRDALAWIFEGGNATLDTTEAEIAARTASLLGVAVAVQSAVPALGMTPEQAAEMIALGGGYLLAGVEEAAVAAERAGMARDAALTALGLAHAALANDRAGKLAWLNANADATVPADLAALDALVIPAEANV